MIGGSHHHSNTDPAHRPWDRSATIRRGALMVREEAQSQIVFFTHTFNVVLLLSHREHGVVYCIQRDVMESLDRWCWVLGKQAREKGNNFKMLFRSIINIFFFFYFWEIIVWFPPFLGHFLLLSASAASRASRKCEYNITSPVVYSSGPLCRLQLAHFESGPTAGNLSVLVKPVDSASVISTTALSGSAQDGTRSARPYD